MTKLTKAITDMWPNLKAWPNDIGQPPTVENITHAAVLAKPSTAVHMALAMYMRTNGATDSEAAIAATAATGSKSNTHRVKRDVQLKAGTLTGKLLESRGGHQVMTVALASKPASKAKAKASKAPTKAKAESKAPAPASAAPAPVAAPEGQQTAPETEA